jgi:hypothetical protein
VASENGDYIIDIEDSHGATPIHYAAKTDNIDVFKKLVELGADMNAETKMGKTAFHIAVSMNSKILEYLLESGARVPADIPNKIMDSFAHRVTDGRVELCTSHDIPVHWTRDRYSSGIVPHPEGACYFDSSHGNSKDFGMKFEGKSLQRMEFKFFSNNWYKPRYCHLCNKVVKNLLTIIC